MLWQPFARRCLTALRGAKRHCSPSHLRSSGTDSPAATFHQKLRRRCTIVPAKQPSGLLTTGGRAADVATTARFFALAFRGILPIIRGFSQTYQMKATLLPQIAGLGSSESAFGPPARVQQRLRNTTKGASFSTAPHNTSITSLKTKKIFRKLLLG